MTVSQLVQMPSREFAYWMAFYRVEPVDEADDIRAALLCSTIANSSGNYGRRRFKVKDFLPRKKKIVQSVEEQIAMFRKLTRS